MATKAEKLRPHLTGTFPVKTGEPVGDQVKLFPQCMPWPSDLREYYDEIDRQRGITPPRLIESLYAK